MNDFRVFPLQMSTVLWLYNRRHEIQTDPEYQRQSDIWGLEKRQLLIDSILNGYDVPKIYFHEFFPAKVVGGKKYKFAIIDGKQRLLALWDFIEGEFSLSPDFELIARPSANLKEMTYAELSQKYPEVKSDFDARRLDVVGIQTEDIEQIEEMFSRLNEAVPLNAAEKRNAFRGAGPLAIRKLIRRPFFSHRLFFPNKRYRHMDLAAKFLYLQDCGSSADTKKIYLDHFVRSHEKKPKKISRLQIETTKILRKMERVFVERDPLLKSVGMCTTYFLLFQELNLRGDAEGLKRQQFANFEAVRAQNGILAAEESGEIGANWDLLEFDRLMQSPNDKVAMDFRLKVLKEFLTDPKKFIVDSK